MVNWLAGALHAALVWQAVEGTLTLAIIGLRGAERVGAGEDVAISAMWLVGLLVIAVPFGWFSMRLAGAANPWRAEFVSLAVVAPVVAFTGTAGLFLAYFVRTGLVAANVMRSLTIVSVVTIGAVIH